MFCSRSVLFVLNFCIIVSYGRHVARPPIGPIRGSIIKSRLGRDIYSFRGIRYGEAPIGEQRFKIAVPAKDWTDEFDATQEGPSCIRSAGRLLSEDCLRLNVYTTKLPDTNITDPLRPVIVFFHPGGFYGFSAQSYLFGPQYLLDKDIVLVTVNYRLSTLGFISTGDIEAPGNLGLKDQVESLKWIQRNIHAFSGDPSSVTLTGCSAGSRSVILHMLSPMSKGLFHRAIAMSGSPIKIVPLPHQQLDLAEKQARFLNCPTNSTKILIDCLRSKPAQDFQNTINKFYEWSYFPIVIWNTVVEPNIPNVERFLPAPPMDLIRQGRINQVPLIIGVTKDELGSLVVSYVNESREGNDTRIRQLNEMWDELAPINFDYERGSKDIGRQLRKFYFNDRPISLDNIDGLARLYADCITIFPSHRLAKLMARYSQKPVYFYQFAYQGRQSFSMWNDTRPYGVVHHDDLLYLFYISYRFKFVELGDKESEMIELMTTIWSRFAGSGVPGLDWEPYDSRLDNYLELNDQSVMRRGFLIDRMKKLEQLFPTNYEIII